jgi:hypothetical protein
VKIIFFYIFNFGVISLRPLICVYFELKNARVGSGSITNSDRRPSHAEGPLPIRVPCAYACAARSRKSYGGD